LSREITHSGAPTLLSEAEGNTAYGAIRKPCDGPARSKTLMHAGKSLAQKLGDLTDARSLFSGGMGKTMSRKPILDVSEKSDRSIVPGKPPNKGPGPAEVVEERDRAKGNADKPPAPRTQSRNGRASMGLEGVRQAARREPRLRFTALLHHITPTLLKESFYALRQNAAAGVDGVTWKEYEALLPERLEQLHGEIHTGRYRPKPSRRVMIPKANGQQRPLGIASLEDKIVQQAVGTVLEAIYEADFLGFSYGFRPGRCQHDALDALAVGIKSQTVRWILDADIQSFFDDIDHDWMIRFLEHRIADRRVLSLIRKWLKVGVIEDGKRVPATRGTPQGAVISPLLANIYLHYALDLWAHRWRRQQAQGGVIIVRYADDSVYGFRHRQDAEAFQQALRDRLGRFGLTVHPQKTRLIEFGRFAAGNRALRGDGKPETFDFLGFTHCCSQDRQGRFKLKRITVKKRMRVTLRSIREKLMRLRHQPIAVTGRWLSRVVSGYYNYYAVPTNVECLAGFRSEVCRAWRHALLRRSQRHRLTWPRFNRYARRFVPYARKLHPYPEERFFASRP
jgi:RNA-directed DNA polymerase